MSKYGRGNYCTPSILKRRGWTDELIRELLPRPHYRMAGGHPIRFWDKEDVYEAEKHPRFIGGKGRARTPSSGPTSGTRRACADLSRAWDGMGNDGSPAWRLAEHYHRAIVGQLPAVSKSRMIRASQATAWLSEFLALEQHCSSKQLPVVLKNFLRAGPWMGEYDDHPVAKQVRFHYTRVLLAAARQSVSDFAAAQPEADLEGLLGARGFPLKLLLSEGLGMVWSVWYVPQAIRSSLSLLIASFFEAFPFPADCR